MLSMRTRSARTRPIKPRAAASCARVLELGWVAKLHRLAGVDQGVKVEVFLFEEQLEEQAVEAGVSVPIDEAEVVAGDVVAEVGELDALTFALAAALALHAAAEDAASDQLELFQLGEQLRSEQGTGDGGHTWQSNACRMGMGQQALRLRSLPRRLNGAGRGWNGGDALH